MNTIETIKLDRVPKGKMPVLHASQYDNGRTHGIDLTNLGEEWKLDGTETLTINERKVDNNICSMDIENTFQGSSHIEFASFLQMCACAGSNFCELRISKGGVDIGTLNFILEVEPDPTTDGIESESEIRNLKTQVEAITEEVIGDDYYTKTQTDEAIANATEGKADTTYVDTELAKKMDKANPTGTGSFSLNRKADTIIGQRSFAEGNNNEASGDNSHAECRFTTASGSNSHSEGNGTTASGDNSHAEGQNATASGIRSHAEGHNTTASGSNSHSEGLYTIASHKSQHVFGEYNIPDDSTALPTERGNYTEIVGNGTSVNNRSNARTLDWSGNETLAGDLTFNGNKSLTSEISRLDGRIDNLPAPMVFKGTLGTGGTIEVLPVASDYNEGWTYKVITDGTYAGQTAKVGDVFTSNGSAWVYIPSGDEDNDTWRNIKVNGIEALGNGISSGSVDFVGSENIDVEFDNNGNKIGIKTKNIYTETEVNNLVAEAIYGVLPSDVASGSVANFETDLVLPIKSLGVDVNAVQEAGTPTPSTPKAISGWNAITLDVNGTTEVINLGGTYYGGHFTQDKAGHRQLVITYSELLDMGDIEWSNFDATNSIFRASQLPNCKAPVSTADRKNGFMCTNYPASANVSLNENMTDKSLLRYNGWIVLRDTSFSSYTEVAEGVRGAKLFYELATPYTIDLPDGEPIITFIGTNNIYADTGDSTVVFKCSVNDYINAHQSSGAKSLGGVFLGGSNSGSEEEPTEESEEPKEDLKEIGEEPISRK